MYTVLKKILLISIHGDPLESLGSVQAGGQNNYVKQLMYALSEKGYKVDVLTHWSDPEKQAVEIVNDNLRVIRISANRLNYIPKDNMYDMLSDFYEELNSRLSLKEYDMLHTNYWLSGILGYVIKRDFKLPWTHTSHSLGKVKAQATGEIDTLRVRAEDVIFRNADTIIATTENEKKVILNNYDIQTKVRVISIGVDPAFFLPTIPQVEKDEYFLYVGRLEENKGIKTLIAAFKKLLERSDRAVKLKIVGGGSKSSGEFSIPEDIKESIKGIEEKIVFTGGLEQDKLVNVFANALATIVPSYYESFGMVAAEAQATGVPVIATKVGGLQEVVKNEVTGYLFEKKNADHLATFMLKTLENEQVREILGKQAREHAQQTFDWDIITNKIISLYKELNETDEEEISISN